jgi:hypothetical protein
LAIDQHLVRGLLGEGPPERHCGVQGGLARLLGAGIEDDVIGEPSLRIEGEGLAEDVPLMVEQAEGVPQLVLPHAVVDEGDDIGVGQGSQQIVS